MDWNNNGKKDIFDILTDRMIALEKDKPYNGSDDDDDDDDDEEF